MTSEPADLASTTADSLRLPRMHQPTQGEEVNDKHPKDCERCYWRGRAEAAEREVERLRLERKDWKVELWEAVAQGQQDRAEAAERALADERAKVARVEAQHPRGETWYEPGEGEVTTDDDQIDDGCQSCRVPWPCPTAAALAGPEPEATR